MNAVRIGIIGDYDPKKYHHPLTTQAIHHAANQLGLTAQVDWLPTVSLEDTCGEAVCAQRHGLWAAPGSPYASKEGALNAIRFARECEMPFIGT